MPKREPQSKKTNPPRSAQPSSRTARGGAGGSTGGGAADVERAMAERGAAATGEDDTNYNLVSVLYHALKAADSATEYVQDATADADEEMAQFMEYARVAQVELASRARQLLAERLGADEEDDEDDEDDEDEDD